MGETFFPQAKYLIIDGIQFFQRHAGTQSTHFDSFDSSNRLIKDSAVTTGVSAILIKSYTY